jgi:hypothetical protein
MTQSYMACIIVADNKLLMDVRAAASEVLHGPSNHGISSEPKIKILHVNLLEALLIPIQTQADLKVSNMQKDSRTTERKKWIT